MRKLKYSKTFRTFLISYVIILVITLITAIISYHTSIKIAESKSIESSLLVLNQSKTHLERRLAEVEKFSRQLARNSYISVILGQGNVGSAHQYNQISRELLNNIQSNEFLEDSYIYLKQDEVIITPGSVFFRPHDFDDLYQYQHFPYTDSKSDMLQEVYHREILPLQNYEIRDKQTSVITYLQSIPLDSFTASFGMIVIPIEQRKISNLFTGISEQYGGWAYISDQQGNPLAYVGTDQESIQQIDLDMKKNESTSNYYVDDTLIISTQSENGWIYYAGIPKKMLMKEANTIKKIAGMVTVFTVLVGLIVSLFLAYRNSKPLQTLIGILREESKETNLKYNNEYDFLKGNIASLISNKKTLQTELNEQLPMLKDAFIKQLIRGDFYSEKEVKAAASQVDIKLYENVGYVGIIDVKGYGSMEGDQVYEEVSAARIIIKKTLTNIEPNLLLCYQGRDKIIVIFPPDKEKSSNGIGNIIGKLQSVIGKTYRISLNMFIGGYFNNYLEINRSYNQAIRTMEYAELMNLDGIQRYTDVKKEGELYDYPIEMEMRFSNHLKKGEYSGAKQVINDIFKSNFQDRNLPLDMGYLLIGELKSTFIKVLEPKIVRDQEGLEKLKNRVLQIQLGDSNKKVQADFVEIAESYCEFVEKWQRETDHEVINNITQFLEENYHDSGLTLYVLAENIGRPENFLSHFFKEKTGESIMVYLENLRMKKATELLINTNETIDYISNNVGYNSSHSFRRASKTVMKKTPKVYRKINK